RGLLSSRAQLGYTVGHLHQEAVYVLEPGAHVFVGESKALESFKEAGIARRSLGGAPDERAQAGHEGLKIGSRLGRRVGQLLHSFISDARLVGGVLDLTRILPSVTGQERQARCQARERECRPLANLGDALEVHLDALGALLYPLLGALEPFAKTRGSGAQVNLQIGNRRHLARLPPLPSGKARGSCSPRLLKWSNELSPDTGAGLHRPGTFTAQQVVRCQHLPLLDVLAKGRRPVVDDPSRVSRQH